MVPDTFVGRDRELRVLESALGEAAGGQARLLTVVGEPGIGKTRLVEEFVRHAGIPSGRALWGRCPEHTGAPSYWPWSRVLRSWADERPAAALHSVLGADQPVLARLLPSLGGGIATVDADRRAESDRDTTLRFELFDATARFLKRVASSEVLVVVLEDVHWADEASLGLLEFVAHEMSGARLLLVATYRDRERQMPRALAGAVRLARRIALRGLGRDAVESFVARAKGGAAAPVLVERLYDLTGGNPFFLDEVLRGLAEDAERGAGGERAPLSLPESVRDAVRRRLDPLSADDRALLAVAAVVGREFDAPVLQEACALDPPLVLQRLDDALARGLVEEQPGVGRFRFSHALVRDTVYGDLLPAARVHLHERVGSALQRIAGDDPEGPLSEIARHFLHAAPLGTAAKAVDYATRAGRRARSVGAHHDAMIAFDQALAAASLDPSQRAVRLGLRLACAEAALRAGYNQRAKTLFQQAAGDARRAGDRAATFRAAIGFATATPPSGGPEPDAVALLEEALRGLPDGDSPARAAVLSLLVQALYFSPERDRCLRTSEEALAVARRNADPRALCSALLSRVLALLGPGDPGDRLALADEALAVAEAHGLDEAAYGARFSRTHCLLERGDVAAATREIERMSDDAERSRLPDRLWHVAVHRASLALLEGRFDDGARLAAEALAVRRDASDSAVLHVFTVQMFLGRRDTDHPGGLEGSIRWLVSNFPAVPAWRAVLAVFLADLGRPEDVGEVRTIFERFAANDFAELPRDFLYPASLAWLARIASFLSDGPRALTLYRLLLPFAERNIVVSLYAPGCLGSAHRYLALLATHVGAFDAAEIHFQAAIAMNARMAARPVLACTQHEYARMLQFRRLPGDLPRAAALLDEARATAVACGVWQLARWIERLGPIASEQSPSEPARTEAAGAAREAATERDPAAIATLRREDDCWVVDGTGATFQLKETKGVAYLAALLRRPGQQVHVLDLTAAATGDPAGAPPPDAEGREDEAAGVLEPAARASYRARLEDLRDDLAEAERFNDYERAARARQEIELIADELAREAAPAAGDRARSAETERARVSASRTIAAAIRKIAEESPLLGEHLRATVRTGYFCSYMPDPRSRVVWQV